MKGECLDVELVADGFCCGFRGCTNRDGDWCQFQMSNYTQEGECNKSKSNCNCLNRVHDDSLSVMMFFTLTVYRYPSLESMVSRSIGGKTSHSKKDENCAKKTRNLTERFCLQKVRRGNKKQGDTVFIVSPCSGRR